MELVRTVKLRRRGRGMLDGRYMPDPRNSVSSVIRLGRYGSNVGMAAEGAPLRHNSRSKGTWESTEIKIVGGTPAQRCNQNSNVKLNVRRSDL